MLDEELRRLPEIYRAVIVLCELEDRSRKETARQLGVPEGTVAGRLARARALLAKRLIQRGVTLSAGALATILSQNVASAGVSTSLINSTVKAATVIAAGKATLGGVFPATVAALTEGVMMNMMLTKLSKATVAGLVALCLCGLVIGGFQALPAQETKTQSKTEDKNKTATAKECMEQLQGTWAAIAPIANCGERKSITFSGNRYSTIEADGTTNSGTLKLVNVTGNPKSIDWEWDGHEGHIAYGIFEIDGNTLYLIGHQDSEARPTDFTSLPGRFGHVCKRVKEQK